MTKTLHGTIRGKTIELSEDPGIPEGQGVSVELTVLSAPPVTAPPLSEGLSKVYEVLGRRYSSGHSDTAERHNEHQLG